MKSKGTTTQAEVSEGKLTPIEVGSEKLMLARVGGVVRALGRTCPHAGADLTTEGIVCDGHVVCKWHKSRFALATGKLVEPPAVDPLPVHPVTEDADGITVTLATSDEAHSPPPVRTTRCVVVVGAGAAGAACAQTLREEGFDGRIVLFDRDGRVPYDRTVLSKYDLAGTRGGEKTPLQTQQFYAEHHIERIASEVTALDATTRLVDGSLPYDAALVATGAAPTRPAIPGIDTALVLRSRGDAERIVARAERSASAIVLGGGFIGMEAAASLRSRGLAVTVVLREHEPFARVLGPEVGAVFRRVHEARGVDLRRGRTARQILPDGVELDDGVRLHADLVIAAYGVKPDTRFVRGVTHTDDGGIEVDDGLRAAEGLWVAGDAAAFPYGGERIRVEHWRVAQQQGRLAARAMLGAMGPMSPMSALGAKERFTSTPYFWTTHFGQRLDYVGHASSWDAVEVDGDLARADRPSFVARYLRNGRVVAVAGWSRDEEMAQLLESADSLPVRRGQGIDLQQRKPR